jgi:hypothetical protein
MRNWRQTQKSVKYGPQSRNQPRVLPLQALGRPAEHGRQKAAGSNLRRYVGGRRVENDSLDDRNQKPLSGAMGDRTDTGCLRIAPEGKPSQRKSRPKEQK